jgi:hypothetical protein
MPPYCWELLCSDFALRIFFNMEIAMGMARAMVSASAVAWTEAMP